MREDAESLDQFSRAFRRSATTTLISGFSQCSMRNLARVPRSEQEIPESSLDVLPAVELPVPAFNRKRMHIQMAREINIMPKKGRHRGVLRPVFVLLAAPSLVECGAAESVGSSCMIKCQGLATIKGKERVNYELSLRPRLRRE